jgi:O-antigen/teichoic acid export membrane protein
LSNQHSYGRRATKGFAWNYLYKLSEFGLLNIYNIIIARFFGPEGSTPYVVYTALGTTISVLATIGVDGIMLRYLPRIVETERGATNDISSIGVNGLGSFVRRLFVFRLFTVAIVILLTAIAFLILPYFYPSIALSLGTIVKFAPYLIIFLIAQAIIAFCSFTLIALLDIKMLFFTSITIRSIAIAVLGILYLNSQLGIEQAVRIHASSAVIIALVLIYVLYRVVSSRTVNRRSPLETIRNIKEDLKKFALSPKFLKAFFISPVIIYGVTSWGNDILSAVLGKQPDILMMRAFFGEGSREIGIYNVASILLLLTEYLFLFGFGGTLVSVLSKVAHDDESTTIENKTPVYEQMTRTRKEVAGLQNILLIPLCGFMMTFAFLVVETIYGVHYADSVSLLQFGLVILAINVGLFGGGLQLTSLVAIGKVRLCFKNRLFWGIANLIGNFFLIQRYGALGAIIGSQLANALACITEEFFARKFIGPSVNYFSTLRVTVLVVALSFVSFFAVKYITPFSFTSGKLIFGGGIYIILVCGIFYLLKLPEFMGLLKRLRVATSS